MESIHLIKKASYLEKLSNLGLSWNKRWVEFDGETLRYSNEGKGPCKAEIKICSPVVHHHFKFSFLVKDGNSKSFIFQCANEIDRNNWLEVLNNVKTTYIKRKSIENERSRENQPQHSRAKSTMSSISRSYTCPPKSLSSNSTLGLKSPTSAVLSPVSSNTVHARSLSSNLEFKQRPIRSFTNYSMIMQSMPSEGEE